MRRRLGWLVLVLASLSLLAGLALMVVLGPDSRFVTGPHEVDTDGIAVVTAPRVISYSGLRIDVLAEVPVNKPVFVGLGNTVDVQDYLGAAQRLEVTSFSTPWEPRAREVEGTPALPGAPTALDWWISDSAGLGGASISTTLPDETVSLAILSVGATNLSGLQVTFAYGLEGGFAQGAGLALLGVGGLIGGRALVRDDELFLDDDDDDEELYEEVEEVVYVYVDEDGVEHEISEQEAERLTQEQEDEAHPASTEEPVTAAASERPPAIANVVTAGDIVAGVVPTEPEPELEPEPTPIPERVVYVFVDEDGVEHEVGEDELADFEVVDDDEAGQDEEGRA